MKSFQEEKRERKKNDGPRSQRRGDPVRKPKTGGKYRIKCTLDMYIAHLTFIAIRKKVSKIQI